MIKVILLINQQNAHERVLYERFMNAVSGKGISTQRSLFPATIDLTPADTILLTELLPDLNQLGLFTGAFWQPYICNTRHTCRP
jgi:DNA mismatch repair protein MutL